MHIQRFDWEGQRRLKRSDPCFISFFEKIKHGLPMKIRAVDEYEKWLNYTYHFHFNLAWIEILDVSMNVVSYRSTNSSRCSQCFNLFPFT